MLGDFSFLFLTTSLFCFRNLANSYFAAIFCHIDNLRLIFCKIDILRSIFCYFDILPWDILSFRYLPSIFCDIDNLRSIFCDFDIVHSTFCHFDILHFDILHFRYLVFSTVFFRCFVRRYLVYTIFCDSILCVRY